MVQSFSNIVCKPDNTRNGLMLWTQLKVRILDDTVKVN